MDMKPAAVLLLALACAVTFAHSLRPHEHDGIFIDWLLDVPVGFCRWVHDAVVPLWCTPLAELTIGIILTGVFAAVTGLGVALWLSWTVLAVPRNVVSTRRSASRTGVWR